MPKRFIKISRKDSTLAAIYDKFDKAEAKRTDKFAKKYIRPKSWQPNPSKPYTGFK